MNIALFPDGTRLNLDVVNDYSLSGDTVTVNLQIGDPFVYTAPTGLGPYIIQQLDTYHPGQGMLVISTQPYSLQSIDQANVGFLATTTSPVDIRGTGFPLGTSTLIIGNTTYWTSGPSAAYTLTCTYVDSTHLTAVYAGSGSTLSPGPVLMAMKDANGNYSNAIPGTCQSDGLTITIP